MDEKDADAFESAAPIRLGSGRAPGTRGPEEVEDERKPEKRRETWPSRWIKHRKGGRFLLFPVPVEMNEKKKDNRKSLSRFQPD